jgi:hypothetical protein
LRPDVAGDYVERPILAGPEIPMRRPIAAIVMIMMSAIEAQAGQSAAWCAWLSGYQGFISDCSYFTLEQCRATIWGVGGYCAPNVNARPPFNERPYRHARRPQY